MINAERRHRVLLFHVLIDLQTILPIVASESEIEWPTCGNVDRRNIQKCIERTMMKWNSLPVLFCTIAENNEEQSLYNCVLREWKIGFFKWNFSA